MNTPTNGRPKLVLLIDSDPAMRQSVVPLLARSGMELVQVRDSVAGLEILQRLPERFRLAIISLEMPGLSGTVLIQTLRLFRPDLPIVCLTHRQPVASGRAATQCLDKPVRPELLRAQLEDALAGVAPAMEAADIRPDAVARAKACFARSRSLLDAAREVAGGLPGEAPDGW
jgi:DNA-binding response OmpR family regulator